MRRPLLTLLALAALTFLAGLGQQAITDADEAYYAEASREMLTSGDWLTPRFNFADRWQKPVLYYWLAAATFAVTGVSDGAARLPAALSGLGLVVVSWWLARQLRASPGAAWLAGAIAATTFGYFTMARAALPDLPLALCITATIGTALRAADASAGPLRWWLLAGAAGGAGFLMKGPVALAVPVVVLLPIWWLERRTLRVSWTGIVTATVTAAAVGLPWYVAMYAAHGWPYLQSFFLTDNLERFATPRFNEPRPLWFYPAVIAGGLLPWTFFGAAAAISALAAARGLPALAREERRLWVWALAPALLFMASVGQQPRYVLPVLPPLAMLIGGALDRRVVRGDDGLAWPTAITAALLAALAGALLRLRPALVTVHPWAPWLGAATLAAGAGLLLWVALSRRWSLVPATMAVIGAVVLLTFQFGALAGRRPEAVERIAQSVIEHGGRTTPVGPYRVFVRNLVFHTGLRQEDLFDEDAVVRFLQSSGRVLLVVRPEDLRPLEHRAGVTTRELARVTYLNTANLRLRALLQPAAELLDTVVLVTNGR